MAQTQDAHVAPFGAALAAIAGITGGPDKGVLFGEWIAIWAFGASWLAKGAEWETLFGNGGAASVNVGTDRPSESTTTTDEGS